MLYLILASATVVLLLGCFPGPAKNACDCQRCWYVNEPPEGTPACPGKPASMRVVWMLASAAIAALGMLLLRKKRKWSPASDWLGLGAPNEPIPDLFVNGEAVS